MCPSQFGYSAAQRTPKIIRCIVACFHLGHSEEAVQIGSRHTRLLEVTDRKAAIFQLGGGLSWNSTEQLSTSEPCGFQNLYSIASQRQLYTGEAYFLHLASTVHAMHVRCTVAPRLSLVSPSSRLRGDQLQHTLLPGVCAQQTRPLP